MYWFSIIFPSPSVLTAQPCQLGSNESGRKYNSVKCSILTIVLRVKVSAPAKMASFWKIEYNIPSACVTFNSLLRQFILPTSQKMPKIFFSRLPTALDWLIIKILNFKNLSEIWQKLDEITVIISRHVDIVSCPPSEAIFPAKTTSFKFDAAVSPKYSFHWRSHQAQDKSFSPLSSECLCQISCLPVQFF